MVVDVVGNSLSVDPDMMLSKSATQELGWVNNCKIDHPSESGFNCRIEKEVVLTVERPSGNRVNKG